MAITQVVWEGVDARVRYEYIARIRGKRGRRNEKEAGGCLGEYTSWKPASECGGEDPAEVLLGEGV